MRPRPLAALLTLLSLTGLGPAGVQAQDWTAASGQGTLEAQVTGSAQTRLIVACSAGQEKPMAVAFLQSAAPFQGTVGQLYPVTFTIDGTVVTLVMTLSQETILDYEGTDRVFFRALDNLVRDLRAGRGLSIAASHLNWQEDYSLKGSGKALDGIFKGCEPGM